MQRPRRMLLIAVLRLISYTIQHHFPRPDIAHRHAQDQADRAMGSDPFGRSNDPLSGVTYQISCISYIYITIHNSSKKHNS